MADKKTFKCLGCGVLHLLEKGDDNKVSISLFTPKDDKPADDKKEHVDANDNDKDEVDEFFDFLGSGKSKSEK